jgi:hypothetical protein
MTATVLLLALISLVGEPTAAPARDTTRAPVRTADASAEARVQPVSASNAKNADTQTAPRAARSAHTLDEILVALRTVETGGERHGGRHATGDGGVAIGPYQIHRAYWSDARLPGRFEDCRDPRYARAVVVAYWRRYCPEALAELDAQTLARVHNGGPDGHRETCTLRFWSKVERELAKLRAKAAKPSSKPASPKPAPAPTERPVLV